MVRTDIKIIDTIFVLDQILIEHLQCKRRYVRYCGECGGGCHVLPVFKEHKPVGFMK